MDTLSLTSNIHR